MTNEVIKGGETIYLCYQNPINHSWLVHDDKNKFSIMLLEQVQDNKEGYVFKVDDEINGYINFFLRTGFDFNELMAFLPTMIEMYKLANKNKDDGNEYT